MKKTAAFLLTLLMLFSLSLTAFAAPGFPPGRDRPLPDDPQVVEADTSATQNSHDDALTERGSTEESTEPAQSETEAIQKAEETQRTEETQAAETQSSTESVLSDKGVVGSVQDTPAQEDTPDYTIIMIAAVCGAIVLILLIVIFVILLRKKRPADTDEPTHGSSSWGMPVRLEILSGECYNAELNLRLRRNLTIGTDKGCDIVFEDSAMQPLHAVISVDSNTVTLDECSSAGVTYIGGMKIFAPNRLRSGDIVTIGATSFCIFFE